MKKADLFFIAGALLLAAVIYFFVNYNNETSGGMRVVIYTDGEVYMTAELTDETEQIEIDAGRGINIVSIYPDGVEVAYADCPSRDCVRAGKIKRAGQSICCLPHRLLIRLENNGTEEVDAVAR